MDRRTDQQTHLPVEKKKRNRFLLQQQKDNVDNKAPTPAEMEFCDFLSLQDQTARSFMIVKRVYLQSSSLLPMKGQHEEAIGVSV